MRRLLSLNNSQLVYSAPESQTFIKNSLREANELLNIFLNDKRNIELINNAVDCCVNAIKNENIIFSCGNGGSMCDSMHFAEELTGRFKNDRRAIGAVAISDPSHMTCVGNDFGFNKIFSRYVEACGRNNDVLIAISTSGNSDNIINAANAAKLKNMKIIGLLGKDGGKLKSIVDIPIIVPHDFSARIQEIHIKVIHIIIDLIERKLSL